MFADEGVPCANSPADREMCFGRCLRREECLALVLSVEEQLGTTLRGYRGGTTEIERRHIHEVGHVA